MMVHWEINMNKLHKFLIGKLINLVVVEGVEDIAKIRSFRNDSKLGCFIGRNFPFTTEMTADDINGKDKVFLGIAQGDEIIGFITLRRINLINGTGKLTVFLGDGHHGKGIGSEAVTLMLGYAFNTLNLRKVNADVFDFNAPSLRCFEKLGFRRQGVLEKEHFVDGRYHDDILLRIFKQEWQSRQATLKVCE